jgi:hypothetical protein
MTGGLFALAMMGAVVLIASFIVWSAVRASARAATAEANEAFAKRLKEDIENAERADAERAARMADAGAAVAVEPADRVRARMRKRPANTR